MIEGNKDFFPAEGTYATVINLQWSGKANVQKFSYYW